MKKIDNENKIFYNRMHYGKQIEPETACVRCQESLTECDCRDVKDKWLEVFEDDELDDDIMVSENF